MKRIFGILHPTFAQSSVTFAQVMAGVMDCGRREAANRSNWAYFQADRHVPAQI
ncbi:MAG: hypothetical protein AAGM21_14455 [Pseudomonadota bacterium]